MVAVLALDEIVGVRIPERIAETDTRENGADFVGVWASGCGREAIGIPRHGHLPQLRQCRGRSSRIGPFLAPII